MLHLPVTAEKFPLARRGLWPLSAVLTWSLCWLVFLSLAPWGTVIAFGAGAALGGGLALLHRQMWRRLIAGLGFPASVLLHGAALDQGWLWGSLLLLLLLLYPRRSWRDAPMYPTPRGALSVLPQWLTLAPGALVLDAGCGMGHGLQALGEALPRQHLVGVEWSRLLCWLARWRCPSAQVICGDMWAHDWRPYQLVYLFQRPESMGQALIKAQAELQPGAWLLSLDFELPGRRPDRHLSLGPRHQLLLYRF